MLFAPAQWGCALALQVMAGVTRVVSLSDWLAFQARIRGFENPRLLRDRPSDGAALVCENLGGVLRAQDENYVGHILFPT